MNLNKFQKIPIILLFLIACLLLLVSFSDAQTSPEFFVSWQADNYAPSWYEGKLLPVNGTPIEVAFELVDNDKPADLSKMKVRWYVNGELVKNEDDGLGIKSLKFPSPDYATHETEIKITVVDYKDSGNLNEIVKIPTVGPEAVINAPYPEKIIGIGSSVFGLIPFFFNIRDTRDLSVEWLVNGQKASQIHNPYLFNLNIAPETPLDAQINVSVSLKNILKQTEFADKTIQLLIK